MSQPWARYILLGPPAVGKGTTAKLISEITGAAIISPGEIYARILSEDNDLSRRVRKYLEGGGICPDGMTNEVVLNEAHCLKNEEGYVLDGYPRSQNQMDFLRRNFVVGRYIHLDADTDALREAAVNRRKCRVCGNVFSLNVHTGSHPCSCTSPEEWVIRFDDSEDMFAKRYQTYLSTSLPMIEVVKTAANYLHFIALGKNPQELVEKLFPVRELTVYPKSVDPAW